MIVRKPSLTAWFVLGTLLLGSVSLLISGCKEANNTLPVAGYLTEISGIGAYGTSATTTASATTTVSPSATGSGVDLTGKAYDSALGVGFPVSGVQVKLDQKDIGTTSSNGDFVLGGVLPGNHNLSFEMEDYETHSIYFSLSSTYAVSRDIGAPMVRKTYTFSGKVLTQDTTKTPIENAVVSITELNISTTTTSSGEFTFPAIKSGVYNLVAKAASSNFSQTTTLVEVKKDGSTSPATVEVLLPSNNFNLSGFVRLNTSREGLANINVDLWLDNVMLASTTTTGEGKFFFQNLSSGLYNLIVAGGSTEFKSAEYRIQVLTDGTFSPTTPEIFLTRLEQQETYTASGTVKDAFSFGPLEYVTCNIKGFGQVLTDSRGIFSFKNLPLGTYQLEFSKLGFSTLNVSFTLDAGGNFSPTKLDYMLIYNQETGKGSIAGRLYDEKTKSGVSSLIVRAYDMEYIPQTISVMDIFGNVKTVTKYLWAFSQPTLDPVKSTTMGQDNQTTPEDESGTFKLTHLPPTTTTKKYYIFIGNGLATMTTQIFSDAEYPTMKWNVPTPQNRVHSWSEIEVTANTTTYLSNYEKENY
jgi:hypothetical protein